jgi:outer membrane protein assembly factor BamB
MWSVAQLCAVLLVLVPLSLGAKTIALSPPTGPPTSVITVSGSGFAPNTLIGVAFGKTIEASVLTNGSGSFQTSIQIPAGAQPGGHPISAMLGTTVLASKSFLVRTNWPQFGFNAAGSRWNPYENTLSVLTAPTIVQRWQNDVGNSFFSPTVANGVVYAGYSGTNHNYLGAFNASTGTLRWRFAGFVRSSPAVANGVVYFGTVGHNVNALNASTGTALWSFATGGSVWSSPTVANGMVYVGSDDKKVYALNASTGAMQWSFATGDRVETPPVVANGAVYVASNDDYLYVLNAKTGALLWRFGNSWNSSPAVVDGVVYVGGMLSLHALDAKTGALLWTSNSGIVQPSPAVANGVVYVGSDDKCVFAFDAKTGAWLWTFYTGASVSSPAVANGVVYAGADDGGFYALNASTGALLWSYKLGGLNETSPVIADGVLYIPSGPLGGLYAFGLPKSPVLEDGATEEP